MKLQIKNLFIITMLFFVTIGGTTSCGSKKKMAKKEYEAKVEQAKKDLNAIINEETQWTLEEQKADIEKRFSLENQRYFELYGVHKEDLNNYDFVLDTTELSPEEVNRKIIEAYNSWLEN